MTPGLPDFGTRTTHACVCVCTHNTQMKNEQKKNKNLDLFAALLARAAHGPNVFRPPQGPFFEIRGCREGVFLKEINAPSSLWAGGLGWIFYWSGTSLGSKGV